MDDPQTTYAIDPLTARVIELEASARSLRIQVNQLSERRPSYVADSQTSSSPTRIPTGKGIDLTMLADWVGRLHERYAAAGDWLRPCWWRHGFVVEELAALRMAWMGVYESAEPPAATAAIKWHEDAAKCRERIRRAISSGPGCTAVNHRPDESATDDPRWSEELSAMKNSAHLECGDAQ